MDLISILIALALDYTGLRHVGKRLLSTLVDSLCSDGGLTGLIVTISAVFLGHALFRVLSPVLGGIFSTVVLLGCLGVGELIAGVGEYLRMRSHGDEEGARQVVSAMIGRDIYSSDARLTREVLTGILVEGHARGGRVVFWYLVLGPAGALLAAIFRNSNRPTCEAKGYASPFVETLCWGFDWLPSRLSALFYGLAGSLTHAFGQWRAQAGNWNDLNSTVLVASGTGALLLEIETADDSLARATAEDQDAAVDNALALVMRALAIWVTAVALITVGGWLK
ncbi:conserved membrane hypothetical protein [Gammaproteobacteria bacterium]